MRDLIEQAATYLRYKYKHELALPPQVTAAELPPDGYCWHTAGCWTYGPEGVPLLLRAQPLGGEYDDCSGLEARSAVKAAAIAHQPSHPNVGS